MKDFKDKVAVITGGASGIGLGMAEVFASEGMNLVLADIEAKPLAEAAEKILANHDVKVEQKLCDVSKVNEVMDLAEFSFTTFGNVNILCNNAGVAGGGGFGPIWQSSPKDWEWIMGVNLMGVVHGLQAFVSKMISSGEEGHIVNTSSILGLTSGGGSIYGVTKHAVTRLTEGLKLDLVNHKSKIGASVLCPGLIATNIISSFRNRPSELQNENAPQATSEANNRFAQARKYFAEAGMSPVEVGQIVLDAIKTDKFYISTHPEMRNGVEARFKAIMRDI